MPFFFGPTAACPMKGQEQREGRRVRGSEVASVTQRGETLAGRAAKGCSYYCAVCFIPWEAKQLGKRDARGGGEGTEPEREQRMGVTYFSVDVCPVLFGEG